MNVALVYDRVNKWGGAERILLQLHKMFPCAPLYTSVYNKETALWADGFTIKTSFLQLFPFAKNHHELYALLMPLVFESFDFSEYDLVISVTSESAKGIITNGKTKHICYILTPTRYLWSGYSDYFKSNFLKIISFPALWYLRLWDKMASERPDIYIAISNEVKKRVKYYYKKDALVVYPPLTIQDSTASKTKLSGYFLVVSRLVNYKRIDLAIQSCNRLKLPLIIIGEGSQEEYLKSIAGPTIQFLGSLTDEEVVGYYKNCRALLFPGNEDFGLTVLEAQRFGKPVIAFRSGGALETIQEGKTGEFFDHQNVQSLVGVLKKFDESKYKSTDCKKWAEKFKSAEFEKNFKKAVAQFI